MFVILWLVLPISSNQTDTENKYDIMEKQLLFYWKYIKGTLSLKHKVVVVA